MQGFMQWSETSFYSFVNFAELSLSMLPSLTLTSGSQVMLLLSLPTKWGLCTLLHLALPLIYVCGVCVYVGFVFVFWWYWNLNLGSHAC
jgi:hypothetical protein